MSEQKSEQHAMAEAAYPFWRYHLWHIGYGSYNEIEAALAAGRLQVFTCTKADCDCKWPKAEAAITPVSQPSEEAPERIFVSATCGGYSEIRESVHDIEYVRASSPDSIAEKAERATAMLGDAGLLRLARNEGDRPTFRRVADIIAAEFGSGDSVIRRTR